MSEKIDLEQRARVAFNKLFDKPGIRSDAEHEQMSNWSKLVYGEGISGPMTRMADPEPAPRKCGTCVGLRNSATIPPPDNTGGGMGGTKLY